MIESPPALNPIPVVEIKHSRLGIASFTVSVVVGMGILAIFIIAGILAHRSSGKPYPGQTAVGLILIALLAADVVAAGLGIAGICQSGVTKVFAILGTVFSVLTILGSIGVILIGLFYASHANQ